MAIRWLLFPEATVSQSASYCLTVGLWYRAQTLSPILPHPRLFPFCLSSLLVLRAIIFIWKRIEATVRSETRKRREGKRRTQRGREWSGRRKLRFFWSCDRCYLRVSAMQTAGLYWFAPTFQSKKWVLNLRFCSANPWIISLSLNKDVSNTSCYAETTKGMFECAIGTSSAR